MYGLYAWGIPAVLTAMTIAMQFGDVSDNVITPGFGSRRCWFDGTFLIQNHIYFIYLFS